MSTISALKISPSANHFSMLSALLTLKWSLNSSISSTLDKSKHSGKNESTSTLLNHIRFFNDQQSPTLVVILELVAKWFTIYPG